MKRMTTLAILVAAAAGCMEKDSTDGVQAAIEALPTTQTLAISVPGAAGRAVPAVGDVAATYLLTRAVAGTLNGGIGLVLGVAKGITEYPVTSIEGDTYVWGPWSDALNPGEYRMTVRLTSAGDYDWAIEGRPKGAGASFAAILSGVATPGRPHRGSGSFTLDCDLAHAVDPYGGCQDGGQLSVSYDLEHTPATVTLDAEHLAPMPDGSEAPQTFHYEYSAAADGSGSLSFTAYGDGWDPGPAWETTTYTSRWKATGAGRTDVGISGGDLGSATASAVECWNTGFQRTYYTDSQGWSPTEGSAATCVF